MVEAIEAYKATEVIEARQAIGEDLHRRFIAYAHLDVRPKTAQGYDRALRPFFQYLAQRGVDHPTRLDVMGYREAARPHLKDTSLRTYMAAVKLFFKWTDEEGIYRNIARGVKNDPVELSHRRDYLTETQVRAILRGIDRANVVGKRDYAMISLMATSGLRTIEVSRANIADIRELEGEKALYVHGKGRRAKLEPVKVAPIVMDAINDYLEARGVGSQEEPLFTSESGNSKGGRMTTRSVSRIAKDRMIAAGYKGEQWTAHSLRHSAGTLNLLNGGTLQETQQLLRHKSIATTQIYLHNVERIKNDSECRIARAIFGA